MKRLPADWLVSCGRTPPQPSACIWYSTVSATTGGISVTWWRSGFASSPTRADPQFSIPGAGSCIFLHVWRAADQGTVGCTAMAHDALEELIIWLNPDAEPRLVQLPAAERATWRAAWALP